MSEKGVWRAGGSTNFHILCSSGQYGSNRLARSRGNALFA